ncbi:MAG TPA: hypothetical protein VHU19_09180 [Pyrinomonadaceae bacterium]|nr:hypothetical protein [Pyrinomonadaceae bacterium]
MRRFLTASTLALVLLALAAEAFGQTPAPANNVLGDVLTVDAASKQIYVKTDAVAVVIVTISDATRILKTSPGETKLDKAAPMQLSDIAAGDRVLALGRVSADGRTLVGPRVVVVNTKADIAAKQEAERAEWRRRGVVGVVSAVNPQTREITVKVRGAQGSQDVVIAAGGANVKLTRYAPDSIKFSERKPSTFEEVKVGDQLRAKGDRSEDGARFTPEEIVTGSFRTSVGTVASVDPSKNEITIKQAQGNQPLTVVVRSDSVLKQVPPEMLTMMGGPGAGGAGGAGGGERRAGGSAAPGGGQGQGQGQAAGQGGGAGGAGQGGGQGQGQGGGPRRMGGDFMQQMLERLPAVTLAELKPGTMVVVSSTVGADPTRVTAIQLVSNIEPLVAMMSRRPGAGGGGAGASGGAGGASGLGGAGGFNFGFGIGQP